MQMRANVAALVPMIIDSNRRLMMICNVGRCSGTSAITAGTMPPGSVKDLRVGVSEKETPKPLLRAGFATGDGSRYVSKRERLI
jgi:chromosome condensin MukBEF MukE localization factor